MASPPTSSPAGTSARTEKKRRAIVEAASEIFLAQGFAGTSMDDVAARAAVSKQTVYKQFESKQALFVAVVGNMTSETVKRVEAAMPQVTSAEELASALHAYALRQLTMVLNPALMQLRRLVIAEAPRFPELGAALYEGGPVQAITRLSREFAHWTSQGLLRADDPTLAATQFNWLLMGEPINRVMMLGDAAIPGRLAMKRHAANAVSAFLAAYGT